MKILILANNDIGLYNFRKELIEKLIEEKNEIYISLPNGIKVNEMVDMGCEFIETSIDRRGVNPLKDLKLFFKYLKIISTVNPDVVLTYTIKPNVYGGIACRLKNKKNIANVTGLGTASEKRGFINKLVIFLYKIAFKKSKCVFCQNQENMDFLVKNNIGKSKLKLIPGSGVNLKKFQILEYPNDNEIQFVFISRIMKAKGIEEYLKTAEYIKTKYPNTVFNVLGYCEESYEHTLEEMEKNNIIKYHGLQDNIIKFLKNCHCTIHPTYYPEGMSNVLLESCASGRPIITTDRAGCREIVDDGKNGYLIKEKNTDDLIKKVEQFINLTNNEKKTMGLMGRKKVEKEFDRDIVIDAYLEEIYKGCENV